MPVSSAPAKAQLNAQGAAPMYACRAWANFNGTGTVAIRASGNISSITDVGTGWYRLNFAIAMPDANYSVSGGYNTQTTNTATHNHYTTNANYFDYHHFENDAYNDSANLYAMVMR